MKKKYIFLLLIMLSSHNLISFFSFKTRTYAKILFFCLGPCTDIIAYAYYKEKHNKNLFTFLHECSQKDGGYVKHNFRIHREWFTYLQHVIKNKCEFLI
jgi:hypothetical protein